MEWYQSIEFAEPLSKSVKVIEERSGCPIFDAAMTGKLIGGSYMANSEVFQWIDSVGFSLMDAGVTYSSLLSMMAQVLEKLDDPIIILPRENYYSVNMVHFEKGVEVIIHIYEVRKMEEEVSFNGKHRRLNDLEREVTPLVACSFFLDEATNKLRMWNVHPAGHAEIRMPWPINTEIGRDLPNMIDLFQIGNPDPGSNMIVIDTDQAFKVDFLTSGWHGSQLVNYAYFGQDLTADPKNFNQIHYSLPPAMSNDPIFFMRIDKEENDWYVFDILDRIQDATARALITDNAPYEVAVRVGKTVYDIKVSKWDTDFEHRYPYHIEINEILRKEIKEKALNPKCMQVYQVEILD